MRARALFQATAATVVAGSLAVSFLLTGGIAHADSASVSLAVSSSVSSERAVSFGGAGVSVGVDKVSNPSLVVTASGDPTAPTISDDIHTAPTATCAAADDPDAGYFNRTITVTVAAGAKAMVYAQLGYDTTNAAGKTSHTDLEPLGAAPGTSVISPLGVPSTPVPFDLCVS
jgi:hypothetical protein